VADDPYAGIAQPAQQADPYAAIATPTPGQMNPDQQAAYARGQAPTQPDSPESSTLSSIGTGVAKGAAETVHTVGSFLHNHLGIPMPDEILNPQLAGGTDSKNNAELAGKIGEGVGEFFIGDEAVKGLGLAERLGMTQKVAKISAEHPLIAKAIAIGMNAMRTGTVTGSETLAKGGTPTEALEAGAAGAAGGAVLDTAVQGAGALKGLIKTAGTDIQPEAGQALRTAGNAAAKETGASTAQPQTLKEVLSVPAATVKSDASGIYSKVDKAAGTDLKGLYDKLDTVEDKIRMSTNPAEEAAHEVDRQNILGTIEDAKKQAADSGVPDVDKLLNDAQGKWTQSQALKDVQTKIFKNPSIVEGNVAHGTPETVNVDSAITALERLNANEKYGAPRLEQALGKQGAKELLDNLYSAQRNGVKAVDAQKLLGKIKTGVELTGLVTGGAAGLYGLFKK
jgi:hypothetical protein